MLEWTETEAIHVGKTNCGLQFVIRQWIGDRLYTITTATDAGRVLEWSTGFHSVAQAKVFAASIVETKGDHQ